MIFFKYNTTSCRRYNRRETYDEAESPALFSAQQSIIDRLKDIDYDADIVPDYQRIAISGEDVSGVSGRNFIFVLIVLVVLAIVFVLFSYQITYHVVRI